MVAAVGVDGEVADEFAGGGVDDADLEVGDEEDDGGSVEGSSEADVVEAGAVAERELAGGVDAVVSDLGMGSHRESVGIGCGFGERGPGLVWRDHPAGCQRLSRHRGFQ